jgi:hypothetical protein
MWGWESRGIQQPLPLSAAWVLGAFCFPRETAAYTQGCTLILSREGSSVPYQVPSGTPRDRKESKLSEASEAQGCLICKVLFSAGTAKDYGWVWGGGVLVQKAREMGIIPDTECVKTAGKAEDDESHEGTLMDPFSTCWEDFIPNSPSIRHLPSPLT